MLALLRQAQAHGIASGDVARLLAAFGEPTSADSLLSTSAADALVEPLTPRELEVLRLLARGLSNQEIARELVIAVGTVKRHVNSICGKLGVSGRLQAVTHARAYDLL
jgi:LuxR family maltose regulon positive regulatory protein